MNWIEFQTNVKTWAKERGIYDHSTATAQLLKGISELGELADAMIKGEPEELVDAIGDIAVCLVNYAEMKNVNFSLPEVYKTGDDKADTKSAVAHMLLAFGDQLLITEYLFDNSAVVYNFAFGAVVRLSKIAEMNGLNFMQCCESAWNEIKGRKGKMVEGGAFVKE